MELQELIENLLSSQSNVEKLIPLAIQSLEKDMFVKAKFYEGDLLMTMLVVEENFWKQNPAHWKALIQILENKEESIQKQQVSFEMKVDWYGKIEKFRKLF